MINVDIVGCGEVALQYHGPVLKHLRRAGIVRVLGCFDRDARRAQRLRAWLDARHAGTVAPETPAADVHAVIVATPPQWHAAVASPYVRAGRHALVEKPFVGRRADADTLLGLSRQGGGRVLVGHMRRFYSPIRTARDFVLSGGLGHVHTAYVSDGARWGGWNLASTYIVEDPYGGVLYDTGSHLLDTLLFVLGADEHPSVTFAVETVTRDRAQEPSHDVRANFTVTAQPGPPTSVHFAVSRTRSLASGVRLVGPNGTLNVPTQATTATTLVVGGRTFRLDAPEAERQARDLLGGLTLEYLSLVDVIRDRAVPTPLDGHRFLLLSSLLEQLSQGHPA